MIPQIEVFHVHKQGNRSAYLLAKHVLGIIDFSIWIEESHCLFRTSSSP